MVGYFTEASGTQGNWSIRLKDRTVGHKPSQNVISRPRRRLYVRLLESVASDMERVDLSVTAIKSSSPRGLGAFPTNHLDLAFGIRVKPVP